MTKSTELTNLNQVKKTLIPSILITVLFIFLRLTNINLWPIFTDEAIYIRWSQIALNDASLRFIPLTDGKQPLWHWFTMVALKFISDPLTAGRLVSVISGAIACIGICFLSWELFRKKRIVILSALLYCLIPFFLLYDRMAIVDSMLTLWIIWSLYFSIRTAKTLRFDYAMLTGFTLGAGLLTKSPSIFLVYLYPLNLFFLSKKNNLLRWTILLFTTLMIAFVIQNVMRLSPWMHMIERKNLEFIMTFEEFFHEPTKWIWGNLPSLWKWWRGSLTWPVMFTAIFGLILTLLPANKTLSLKKYWKQNSYLAIFALVPFFVAAAFGKVIFARYLLFVSPMLVIVVAATTDFILTYLNSLAPKIIFLAFLLLPSIYSDMKIITDPLEAPIIEADQDQYINGFPAGWGINEAIIYLESQAVEQKIFLGTQGTFGLMPASFELYLWDNPNIEIKGYWPVSTVPEEVVLKAETKPTYFIYYESYEEQIPIQMNIELIKKFRKGNSNRYMYLYRVYPQQVVV